MSTDLPQPMLVDPLMFYDPPYERPLEDEFAWHLVKHLRPITGLRSPVRVDTPTGDERVDFVVELGVQRVGFVLGQPDEESTARRDALLIGSCTLDVLFRFRAVDLLYRPHDALHLVAKWEPTIFSERGCRNLRVLASIEALATTVRPRQCLAKVDYDDPVEASANWGEEVPCDLVLKRFARSHPLAWLSHYNEALRQ